MPRMITEIVSGVVMYGDFIGTGYVPAEEQSDRGEKYYIQITGPNLTSYRARMTDEAYAQLAQYDVSMGMPVLMDVSYSLFNGQVYWRAESFHVRPDGRQPFMRSSPPAGAGAVPTPPPTAAPGPGSGSASAGANAPNASKKS